MQPAARLGSAVNQMKILASEPQVVTDSLSKAIEETYLCVYTLNNMRGFPNKLIYPDKFESKAQRI